MEARGATRLVRGRKLDRYAAIQAEIDAAKLAAQQSEAVLKLFSKKAKQHKQRVDATSRKYDWLQEAEKLNAMCRDLDQDIEASLRAFTESQDKTLVQETFEILHEEMSDSSDRKSKFQSLLDQVGNLRQMCAASLRQQKPREACRSFSLYFRNFQGERDRLAGELDERGFQLENELKPLIAVVNAAENEGEPEQGPEEVLSLSEKSTVLSSAEVAEWRTEVLDKLSALDQQLFQQLNDIVQSCSDESIFEGPKNGSWPLLQHERFLKVVKYCASIGTTREKLLKKLSLELPEISMQEIERHYARHRERKQSKQQREAVVRHWKSLRQESLRHAILLYDELCARKMNEVEKTKQLESQKIICEDLHTRLENLRRDREKLQESRLLLQQQIAEAENYEKSRLDEKQRRLHAKRKAQLALWKEEQAEEALRLRILQQQLEEEQRQEMKIQAKENKERVDVRRHALERRQEEKRQQEAEKERQRQEQLEKLARLAATVEPEVERDPNRVLQATEALRLAKDQEQEAGPLFKVHGYNMHQLLADSKMRLAIALREAGLDRTAAGRMAMSEIQGTLLPRKDTFTSEQLGFK